MKSPKHKLPPPISHPVPSNLRNRTPNAPVDGRIRFLRGICSSGYGRAVRPHRLESALCFADDRDSLSVEVRDFEPAQALFAGSDGLSIYRRLIPAAFDALVSGGFLVLEIGYGQQEAIEALLADTGFKTPNLRLIFRAYHGWLRRNGLESVEAANFKIEILGFLSGRSCLSSL